MYNPKDIGEWVLIRRRRRALPQQELGEPANVGALTISRIERGNFAEAPHPATVRGIADARDGDPGLLMFGDEEMEKRRRELASPPPEIVPPLQGRAS